MAIVNISTENDADFYRGFQYQMASGAPVDITGVSMVMMLRRHAADKAAQLKLSTGSGEIVIQDASNGVFTIYIAQATLERLGEGDFDHSLVMTQSGYKTSIWTGKFTNNPGASR